jgi:hypothetical protein
MAQKVEMELRAEVAQAVAAIDRLIAKQEQLFNKFEEGKDKGKTSFDAVEGAVGKVAAALGVAGGLGQAFHMVLQQIEERAAGISREAEKALSIGGQTYEGSGRLLQNLSTMSESDLIASQQGVNRVLLANPAQGAGAQLALFDALTSVRSAVPALTQEQALQVVNEAAQTRQLDPRINLSDVAGGIGSLSAATGLDPNTIQNLAMTIQGQGFVTDLGKVLKGASSIQPIAKNAGGLEPTDSFALFNFATKTLQDPTGEPSTTAVKSLISKFSSGGAVEELTGLRMQGNAMDRVRQLVEFVQEGNVDEDMMGKLMPKLAEGTEGKTLLYKLFGEGFGVLQAERDAFKNDGNTGIDKTAEALGLRNRAVPGAAANFKRRSQIALREAELSLDELGMNSAAVRSAILEDLEAGGAGPGMLEAAGKTFDLYVGTGFAPESAAVRAKQANSLFGISALTRNVNLGYDLLDARQDENGMRRLPGNANVGEAATVNELLENLVQKISKGVEAGTTRAFQNTKQRSTVSEESR